MYYSVVQFCDFKKHGYGKQVTDQLVRNAIISDGPFKHTSNAVPLRFWSLTASMTSGIILIPKGHLENDLA